MTRREFACAGGAAMLAPPAFAQTSAPLVPAPSRARGEHLPAVGLGTAHVFDTNDEATRQKAAAVLQALVAGGGSLVDTASVYGDAESVIGDVIDGRRSARQSFSSPPSLKRRTPRSSNAR